MFERKAGRDLPGDLLGHPVDGPASAARDLPEQVAGQSPTGLPLEQYGGNHIVQDIGDGNYAFYAHLKTGSVKVKAGDQLSAGQVIASLGNTGNTDAPHLHFHVMSTPDPLRSDGLPFVLSTFTPRFPSRVAGCRRRAPAGQARADAARLHGARRNRRQPNVARCHDV